MVIVIMANIKPTVKNPNIHTRIFNINTWLTFPISIDTKFKIKINTKKAKNPVLLFCKSSLLRSIWLLVENIIYIKIIYIIKLSCLSGLRFDSIVNIISTYTFTESSGDCICDIHTIYLLKEDIIL